ncbi:MAG: hypothetical protein SV760_00910 [Halobacteria archaeon]|nr:hypothetical protein [Halobacteria archaeon]
MEQDEADGAVRKRSVGQKDEADDSGSDTVPPSEAWALTFVTVPLIVTPSFVVTALVSIVYSNVGVRVATLLVSLFLFTATVSLAKYLYLRLKYGSSVPAELHEPRFEIE